MSVEAFLLKWQTLIGAAVGGLFALAVAVIVARDARARAERAAAMMMIRHLMELVGFWNNVRLIADRRKRGNFILDFFPRLPPDFVSTFGILAPVHAHVAGHLHAVEYMSREMVRMLGVHAQVIGQWRSMYGGRVGADPELDQTIERNDTLASEWAERLANHATCAERLLGVLALSKFPTWNRLRIAVRPSRIERICRDAIVRGSFAVSAFEAGGWSQTPSQQ